MLETIFISSIVFFNFSSINKLSNSLIKENIQTSGKLFSELVKTPIIINDLATLDNAVDSFVKMKDIVAVKIINTQNIVLSSSIASLSLYQQIIDKRMEDMRLNDRTFKLKELDVQVGGETIATVKVIFETTDHIAMQEYNKRITFILMMMEILLSTIAAYFIGHKLTNRLSSLTHSAEEISKNNQVIIPNIEKYPDEVSVLASALHVMQEKINHRTNELEKYINLVNKNIIISHTDLDGIITDASEAFCTISGFSKEELIGKTHAVVKHPDTSSQVYENLWETITAGKTWRFEVRNKRKDGGFFWADSAIYPDYNYNGEIIGYYAIRHDVTDKKEIETLSITDELTQLYNRRHFYNVFNEEMNRAKRERKIFCLLSLDVDNFKKYNDVYGHQEGDKVLKIISNVLKSHMKRAGDVAFRIGGEEFSAIFIENDENNVFDFTEKIRKSIENQKIAHAQNSASEFVTASFGVVYIDFSVNNHDEVDRDSLYKIADDLLYRAKKSGRNKIVIDTIK